MKKRILVAAVALTVLGAALGLQGAVQAREQEPGDDHGGRGHGAVVTVSRPMAREPQPGDDRGGHGQPEPGDDHQGGRGRG